MDIRVFEVQNRSIIAGSAEYVVDLAAILQHRLQDAQLLQRWECSWLKLYIYPMIQIILLVAELIWLKLFIIIISVEDREMTDQLTKKPAPIGIGLGTLS